MRLLNTLAAATALSLAAAAAFAQPPAAAVYVRQVCAADVQKLCPNTTPGKGGGMGKCLRANFSQLSQPCQTAIQQRLAARQQSATPGTPSTPTSPQ